MSLTTPSPAVTPKPRTHPPYVWRNFTRMQLLVMGIATIAPGVVATMIVGRLAGIFTFEQMHDISLGAAENPGMITMGMILLCSPVQWRTGRTQVRVRKYLGIVFALLAFTNGLMFVLEKSLAETFGEPLLVAGSIGVLLTAPLLATSNRRSQRWLGMARWRLLHKLTYVIAIALLSHVLLVGDIGLGAVLISAGFIARIPRVRRAIERTRRPRLVARTQHGERFAEQVDSPVLLSD